MELNAFWTALLRRWYLTVGGGVLAVALTVFIVGQIGPTYKAEGTVLMFPPATTIQNGTTVETQGNPYLLLGGLSQARDIVLRTMKSKTISDAFTKRQPNAEYTVNPDFTTSGPIIVIDVTSHSSTDSVKGLADAVNTVPGVLNSMQSGLGLPASGYITSRVLTVDTKPQVVRSSQIRSGIVVGALVLLVTLLLLALLDGLLEARKERSRQRAQVQPVVPVDDPVDTKPAPARQRRGRRTSVDQDESDRQTTTVGS